MEQTKNDLISKANGLAHDFNVNVRTGEKRLEKFTHDMRDKAEDSMADIAKTASQYVDASRDYVQVNPIKGVAIAATAGLVAGSLLTMALRRK